MFLARMFMQRIPCVNFGLLDTSLSYYLSTYFASFFLLDSKSEYAIYKLKEMGKISEQDVLKICKQFERLDAGNCGKISLLDLMESRQ